jgi:NADH-quinone oxidoreductase subunit E/NADP-reducing hydrogenase subunit HndA
VQEYEVAMDREQMEQIESIIARYKDKPGGLIPVLHEVQKILGYLPRWAQEKISLALDIPLSEVNSIISFYSLFSEKPKGEYCIGVCKGTACYVRESEKILKKLEQVLGIEAGDTTPDGKFSIEVLRCLGACGLGPVMTVNEKVYTRMKVDKIKEIIESINKVSEGRDSS